MRKLSIENWTRQKIKFGSFWKFQRRQDRHQESLRVQPQQGYPQRREVPVGLNVEISQAQTQKP